MALRARPSTACGCVAISIWPSMGSAICTPRVCPIEINYSPTLFNVHEIARAVDLAHELGAYSFYTGRTMYTGNAVKTWHRLAPTEEQYAEFFAILHAKTAEYQGRMRVHFHEMGLLEELRYRLHHPAALLIVLPNGLVKLINALPFVCGDLRRQSLDARSGQLPARLAGSARRAVRRGSCRRSRQDLGLAPMGLSVSAQPHPLPRQRRSPRPTTVCDRWPGPLPVLSLRRAPALSAGRSLGVRNRRRIRRTDFLERACRCRARGRRRRGLQRVLRFAHGHGPRLQPGRRAADVRRGYCGLASRPLPARWRSASTSPSATAGRSWYSPRSGRRGGDLLCGASDTLGLPRPGRDGDCAVVRAVDGAGQPLPADAGTSRGVRCGRRWCRAC